MDGDKTGACRKLDPYVLVMQSTQDRTGEYATDGLDGARNWRVLPLGRAIQPCGAIVTVPILSELHYCYARI